MMKSIIAMSTILLFSIVVNPAACLPAPDGCVRTCSTEELTCPITASSKNATPNDVPNATPCWTCCFRRP